MIATSAISQNWPKQTHWLWRTISSWNNGRKEFSLTFVDEKLQLRTTVDEGRWFWRPNYGPSFFYVQLYRHWRPPFFSVSFVVDPCVKNPHTLQASEHTARERERAPASKSASDLWAIICAMAWFGDGSPRSIFSLIYFPWFFDT
jgi:hypothetical protein